MPPSSHEHWMSAILCIQEAEWHLMRLSMAATGHPNEQRGWKFSRFWSPSFRSLGRTMSSCNIEVFGFNPFAKLIHGMQHVNLKQIGKNAFTKERTPRSYWLVVPPIIWAFGWIQSGFQQPPAAFLSPCRPKDGSMIQGLWQVDMNSCWLNKLWRHPIAMCSTWWAEVL